jgi:hypothetical protein
MSDPASDAMASPPPPAAPAVAPYHPPPTYPPPAGQTPQVTDGRAAASMIFGILGLLFGIPLGLPGMIGGAIAYFLGKGAKTRIEESNGALGGQNAASIGRIVGIIAFAVGARVTLLWLIVIFNALLDPSLSQ